METQHIFIGIAILAVLLILAILALYMRRPGGAEPIYDEDGKKMKLPMTPLEKQAWWGFAIGMVMALGMLAMFILNDPTSFFEDRSLRLTVTAIFLAGLGAYLLLHGLSAMKVKRGEMVLDERDKQIMNRAHAVQNVAVVLTMAVWAIGLTECYWDEGAIPIAFPYIMFWSVLVADIVSGALGVLLSARRI